MSKILIILGFSFLQSMVFCQNDSLLLLAEQYYENQDYENAFHAYSECYKSDSENEFCLKQAAMSSYRLGDLPKAKTLFEVLVKVDSVNRVGLVQLANIYEQEKNTPKAIKYYSKLTKLFQENSTYYRKLAQQYHNAGLLIEAFSNYNKAYKLNSKDMYALQGITEIFVSNQQYVEADSMLLIGLAADTFNIKMNQLLARSKYKQKEYDQTIYTLERITGRVDLSPYFNKMLGYAYIQIDSFERAIYYLQKSLSDEGSKEYAHYYLATAYEKLENPDYALHHYQEALKEGVSDNVSNYHRNLAKIYNEKNKLKEAIPHYQDAIKYGDDPLLMFFMARAADKYYKDKNIAIRYYGKYLKSSDDNAEYKKYSKDRMIYLKEIRHQKRDG